MSLREKLKHSSARDDQGGNHPGRGRRGRPPAGDRLARRLHGVRRGHALDRRGAPPRAGERARRGRHLADALDADLRPLEPERRREPSSRTSSATRSPRAREYQTDSTGTASCEAGAASADYIKITSTVTWPSLGSRPPVVSATPRRAAERLDLAEQRRPRDRGRGRRERRHPRRRHLGQRRRVRSRARPGPTGCVIFGNLPGGQLHGERLRRRGRPGRPRRQRARAPSRPASWGRAPTPWCSSTTTRGRSRSPSGRGTTRTPSSTPPPTRSSSTTPGSSVARVFGTVGTQLATQTATPMFPFTSDYAVYAGTCEGDNPNPHELDPPPAPAAIGSALRAAGRHRRRSRSSSPRST